MRIRELEIQVPKAIEARIRRLKKYLVRERALLDGKEFDRLHASYLRWAALLQTRPELGLEPGTLVSWLNYSHPRISNVDDYRAQHIWFGQPDPGPVPKQFPRSWSESLRAVPRGFKRKGKTGEMLVALGWVSKLQIKETLAMQKLIEDEVGERIPIGMLLQLRGLLSPGNHVQLVALLLGIPVKRVGWDEVEKVRNAYIANLAGVKAGRKQPASKPARRTKAARPRRTAVRTRRVARSV